MTGTWISFCGLRRTLFLRPTMLAAECGSGEGEVEEAGELRTEIKWVADTDKDLRSAEEPRAILCQDGKEDI